MPPRNASKKAKQAVVVAPDQAQVPAPQPPPPPTRFDQEATAAASAVVAVAPSPPPDNDNDNVNAFVMLTSPGRRYLVNFDDMHTHMGRVLGLFQEYEGELQVKRKRDGFFSSSSSFLPLSLKSKLPPPPRTHRPSSPPSESSPRSSELRAPIPRRSSSAGSAGCWR